MLPSFEKYYLNDALVDVCITLFEEAGESGKRKRETQIPAHSMVLAVTSSYCEAKLIHWSDPCSGGVRYRIELPVPKGQLRVGELLVQGMYTDSSSYMQDLEQKQLLELLTLADRYGVPKVQQAVLHALMNIAVADLQWDTAVALLDLPISCRAFEPYQRVVEVAGRKVQMQLGCLEAVWRGEQPELLLQSLLLALPHAALLWLLQSQDTIVWSECTVVYTILQWWRRQSAEAQQLELLKQLMQQVRLQHCSQLYISTVLMNDPLIRQCFAMEEWSTAISASVCQRGDMLDTSFGRPRRVRSKRLQEALPETFQQHSAWSAEARSCHATQYVSPPTEYWSLDVSELQPAAELIFAGNTAGGSINGPKRVFCGQLVQFKAKIHVIKLQHPTQPVNEGPSQYALVRTSMLCIGLHVEVLELSLGAVRSVDNLSFHSESGIFGYFNHTWQLDGTPQCVTSMANTCGVDDFVVVGPADQLTSWLMIESALKDSHVLGGVGDKLTLSLTMHLDIS